MPGQVSLDQTQYYAHPHNSFWYIMGCLFGASVEKPYPQRLSILQQHHIALWDVVHRCRRQGSLDSAIENASVEANDLQGMLQQCPDIRYVFFNGQMAAALFRRKIIPTLSPSLATRLRYQTLPSTSPAHASVSKEKKLEQWHSVKTLLQAQKKE
jgi:hypoxanthine-DNA glycosylase